MKKYTRGEISQKFGFPASNFEKNQNAIKRHLKAWDDIVWVKYNSTGQNYIISLCSTSVPAGNRVDGLPAVVSWSAQRRSTIGNWHQN